MKNAGLERFVKRLWTSAAVLVLIGLTGCGWFIDRTAPDEVRNGKIYFEQLRQRQTDQILQSFDPAGDKDQIRSQLGKVFSLVPQREPIGVETLGASTDCKLNGVCTKLLILEYKYPDHWIVFRVTVSNQSGHDAITHLAVQPESLPIKSMRRFSLRGKGLLYYLMILMAALSAGLAIYSVVLCIRTPIRKRKWLWLLICILGLGKFGLEWASGDLWYKLAFVAILPAGWGFDLDSPFLYISIPAGAILFLILRRRLMGTGMTALPSQTIGPTTFADYLESDSGQ